MFSQYLKCEIELLKIKSLGLKSKLYYLEKITKEYKSNYDSSSAPHQYQLYASSFDMSVLIRNELEAVEKKLKLLTEMLLTILKVDYQTKTV